MKAYELHTDGETEIIAANTVIEALKFYSSLNGYQLDDFDNDDTIEEIPMQTWHDVKIANTEYDSDDKTDKEVFTLFELMGTVKEPELIGSSAY